MVTKELSVPLDFVSLTAWCSICCQHYFSSMGMALLDAG